MSERRTPSSAALEIGLLAGSLKSISRDIERGTRAGRDEFEQPWATHVADRIANVETLLSRIRHDVVQAGIPGLWEKG